MCCPVESFYSLYMISCDTFIITLMEHVLTEHNFFRQSSRFINSVTYISLSQYAHLNIFFVKYNILKARQSDFHPFSSEIKETQFKSLTLLMEEWYKQIK